MLGVRFLGLLKTSTSGLIDPDVPNSVSATTTTDSIIINWASPINNPLSYDVQLNGSNQQNIASPGTTYTYSSLVAGTYSIRVRAVYSDRVSGWITIDNLVIGSLYQPSLQFDNGENSQYLPLFF